MKKPGFAVFSAVLFVAMASCGTSAPVAMAQPAAPVRPVSPYFTGDGGRGTRLAVLLPDAVGLPAEQSYLPTLVQGVLVGDLSRFSAISVLDRIALESVLRETESGIYRTDADFGRLGEIVGVDYVLTGNITRTATGHALQVQVVGTGRDNIGLTRASSSVALTVAEMDDFTGIRRASMELLTRMDIDLTPRAIQEMAGAAARQTVNAQTALARGIDNQRRGTEVAALSFYFQAVAFQPALVEAVNRTNILAADISSGNIGEDARNEIQWRNDWMARIRETEEFFNGFFADYFGTTPARPPHTLVYTANIERIGEIDFRNETMTLGGVEAVLIGSQEWARAVDTTIRPMQMTVQAVLDGLDATGRRAAWGLDNWPQRGAFDLRYFNAGAQHVPFSIAVELVNSRNQVIGRQAFQTRGHYRLPAPLPGNAMAAEILCEQNAATRIDFSGVRVDDVTESLTIRIAGVNGAPAETAARDGVLQIRAVPRGEFDVYRDYGSNIFSFRSTTFVGDDRVVHIYGFNRNIPLTTTELVIPPVINGMRVSEIIPRWEGRDLVGAFQDRGLTSVTIPEGVRGISDRAFYGNNLTSVSMPNGVQSIGNSAFAGNNLTSVTFQGEVWWMGNSAFAGNHLTSVIFQELVHSIGDSAFAGNHLTSVTFQGGVGRIGDSAFAGNNLTNVIIPLVRGGIGERAFAENPLTNVTITRYGWWSTSRAALRRTLIGRDAFVGNNLTSVTICADIRMDNSAFSHRFANAYRRNGRQAGVYILNGDTWVFGGR